MPKFKVSVTYNGLGVYIVDAKNEEEAEDKIGEGVFDSYDSNYDSNHDSNEEIETIELLCDNCKKPEDEDGRCGCTNEYK